MGGALGPRLQHRSLLSERRLVDSWDDGRTCDKVFGRHDRRLDLTAGTGTGAPGETAGKWRIWIDRGGTFTDVVAVTPEGETVAAKLLSENPGRKADAAVQGIRDVMGLPEGEPIPSRSIAHVKMGTTVATNALLERTGERTLLVATKGFGDILRIGYQNRPRIFDLHIVKPEQLYERVVEAEERVAVDGEVVVPLRLEPLERELRRAREDGIESVAIALMHGHRHPAHEREIAAAARRAGFGQVSASHEVSPLVRLVARGDTAVADAYLSPLLRRYVDRVAADLGAGADGGPALMFMRSDGGLTRADLFRGKDAILSGPAGGVVGMAGTGVAAGHPRLIGFDMGGTSTDVSHYDGVYERCGEKVVAGVRIKAPMMDIHTVAAGGGSILRFDGMRYRVGPESAGAVPGPACYRRGGPLTVTDCNLLLGKIDPAHFPKVFGPRGDEPLDARVVREKFGELAREVSQAQGSEASPEEVAEGFLRIACENMANAIKKISVRRGHDITRHVLNCFGGAGGQHACRVADLLGIRTVLVHPHAGVLSAYGMGLAEIRASRALQTDLPLGQEAADRLAPQVEELAAEARAEVEAQTEPGDETKIVRTAHVRYSGTDATLEVPFGAADEMREAFEDAHRRRFGFSDPGRERVVDHVSAEAIGNVLREPPAPPGGTGEPAPPPIKDAAFFTGGAWRDAPVHDRPGLPEGWSADGPAIIVEDGGTNVVEPGWRARVAAGGMLEIERTEERQLVRIAGAEADPIMLEVFNNLFMSIAEQMGVTLENTAYSVNIKERLDFSCAIFDPQGGLVANAPHMPVHLGSMGESVATVLRLNEGRMRPGDVYALNAPYNGGTHLPDVTLVSPVFDEAGREILFLVGSRAHHADVGGRTPGSLPPDSRHIDEEGVLIDNFLVVREGRFLERETRELLGSGRYPCRNPDQNVADVVAQIAANETGAREVRSMIRQFGLDVVQAYMRHVQANAEESIRRVIPGLREGSFRYELDNGLEIGVEVAIDRERREATLDFSSTSAQHEMNFNAPYAVCRAAVLYVFRTLVADDIPLNEGCLRPIRLKVPEGSMLRPRHPAAVIAGNTEVSQCVTDALFGALGALASSQGTMNNFVYGNDRHQNYETICGGSGAGPGYDGADAVHTHMTNTRLTDPEVLEGRYPVRVEEFSIRRGSGGAGRWRGGCGAVRKVRFLEPMQVTTLSLHRDTDPYGLEGGSPGARGRNYVVRADGRVEEKSGIDAADLEAGDLFVVETPGGGGYGSPRA